MPGITSSKIGTLDGKEVVQVEYDPAKTSLPNLVEVLKKQNSFYSVEGPNAQPRFVDSKYSLRSQHPDLYYLDLTEAQAIALNSWSYFGGKMPDVLTPDQKNTLPRLQAALHRRGRVDLQPARGGKELEAYRAELQRWLQQE